MAFLTDEISEHATRRRLDEITTAGLRALDECVERSAQIDEEFREAQAKMAEEAKAMDQLVADAHAKPEADPDKDDQPNQWAKREARPTVLALGGDELTEDAAASRPAGPPPVPQAPPPEPAPPTAPVEPEPARKVLSLGFEEDEPESPAPAPSAPRHARQAPPEDDDDLSNVNWMR